MKLHPIDPTRELTLADNLRILGLALLCSGLGGWFEPASWSSIVAGWFVGYVTGMAWVAYERMTEELPPK